MLQDTHFIEQTGADLLELWTVVVAENHGVG